MALSLQQLSLSSDLVYFVQSEQLIDYLLPILTAVLLVCHILCKRRCSLFVRPHLPDAVLAIQLSSTCVRRFCDLNK